MNLPKLDISSLPGMETISGVFNASGWPGSDDTIIYIMVYVYEVQLPAPEPELEPEGLISLVGMLF